MITVFIHFMNTGKESRSEVTIQQRTIQSVCKHFHPLNQCFLTNSLVTQKHFIKGTLKIISYILWRLNITPYWWSYVVSVQDEQATRGQCRLFFKCSLIQIKRLLAHSVVLISI